jgi:CRP/FNR family transcriptional regulator, cyclic AMP receptor protein
MAVRVISKDRKVELLAQNALLSQCTRKELARIAAMGDEVSLEEGRVLTREGQSGQEFFVIIEGSARVTLRDEELATVGPGGFIGEMALLDPQPRAATVTAATPLRVLVFDRRSFISLLHDVPSVAIKMLGAVGRRLREVEQAQTY